jgi:hypothetical protein
MSPDSMRIIGAVELRDVELGPEHFTHVSAIPTGDGPPVRRAGDVQVMTFEQPILKTRGAHGDYESRIAGIQ